MMDELEESVGRSGVRRSSRVYARTVAGSSSSNIVMVAACWWRLGRAKQIRVEVTARRAWQVACEMFQLCQVASLNWLP